MVASGLLVSACGLLLGIDPELDVKASADAAPLSPDTSTLDGFRSPPVDANPALPPPRRPPEGSYVYAVSGYDQLTGAVSYPRANYGPTCPVTITYIGTSCFELKLALRVDYEETMRLCIVDRDLVQDKGTRYQRFAGGLLPATTVRTTVECKPGDVYLSSPLPAAPLFHDCMGNNSDPKSGDSGFRTFGKYTYVEDKTLMVMGGPVVTNHFLDDRTVSLSQTGSNVANWYFAAADGTLQQLGRTVGINYNSVIGTVNYGETMLMTLVSRPGSPDGGD
ncbi:hypothetical protein BH11MYX4_BH11MYX4_29150 [soil metagenome]